MNHKLKSVLGSGAFYGLAVACLLAVGIGGYHLLLGGGGQAPSPSETMPQKEVPAPEPQHPPAPPVVETIQPTVVEETPPPPMPEVEVDDVPVVAEAPRLVVPPLQGEVLTAFSVDELVYSSTLQDWRTHDGVDISAQPGTTVLAACSGSVSAVTDDALMGTTVVIDHDGDYQTTYANLQQAPSVAAGDQVSAGQIIGAVGTTAAAESAQPPHLHFAVTKGGEAVDPEEFLNQ